MAKGFRFRLERLLDLRRAKEGVAQRALADARRAVEEEERRLAELLAEAEEGRRTSRGQRKGLLDLDVLRLQERYRNTIEERIGTSRERLLALGKAEQEARASLTEAMKAVKVLERVREKRLAEWTRAEDREERKFLDEVALGSEARAREGA